MQKSFYLPPIGQRIVKTMIAVCLCLIFYYFRGYRGESMSAEAAITAIICMQPYASDTRSYAWNRISGTLFGAFWGFLFLLIVPQFPAIRGIRLYTLMGLSTLLPLYSAVVMRKSDASGLAAIVYICVVIVYPDVEFPLDQAFHRVLDVLVGTGIAIGINLCRLPRVRQRDQLFFVHTKDLAPDQLSQIPSAVLFRLTSLNNDGANICLISEHAPAFFMSQISQVHLRVPMIVMNGAGIYDTEENAYLSTVNIAPHASRWLMDQLNAAGISYFIYTIHHGRNFIYHHGTMSREEQVIYQQMKRSPYRQYLDDSSFDPEEIVYIKIIAKEERAERIWRRMKELLDGQDLRMVVKPQAGLEYSNSIYFYSSEATIPHAEKQIQAIMESRCPGLHAREVFSQTDYRSDHDAIHLLHRLSSMYEPLRVVFWLKQVAARVTGKPVK